jgi:hypothetical protein
MGRMGEGATFRGRPLVEWVIERIEPQVADLLVNANGTSTAISRLDIRCSPVGSATSPDRWPATPRRPEPGSLRAGGDTVPCDCLPPTSL